MSLNYAEVAVAAPAPPGKAFSYSIPEGMVVLPGHAVQVPFGQRQMPGFVIEVTAEPSFPQTRPIARVIDVEPWLSPQQVALARWLSRHTYCSLYSAAAQMVPAAFRQKVDSFYESTGATVPENVSGEARELLDLLAAGAVSQRELERRFGRREAPLLAGRLAKRQLVRRVWRWQRPTVRPKYVPLARLGIRPEDAEREVERLASGNAKKQAAILSLVAEAGLAGVTYPEITASFGPSTGSLEALEQRGLILSDTVRVERDPLAGRIYEQVAVPPLTPDQQAAWAKLAPALEGGSDGKRVWLAYGVTGSGKTELYLRALERVVAQGRRGILLVPEIALTPQTIERVSARFPNRVAVLHSALSPGEYFDEWWRIRQGEFDVVVGSRGAIFAPQPGLGLIVLDEEHEWTYKQSDAEPRYHARDVAEKLAELHGATVLLGSATPSLESYHRALSGRYGLLELPNRIVVDEEGTALSAAMPTVEVVDLRAELKAGNRSIFSRHLYEGITRALAASEQVILFLNRRGTSSFVQCRSCGHVIHCRRCSTTMTYHGPEWAPPPAPSPSPYPPLALRTGQAPIKGEGKYTAPTHGEAPRGLRREPHLRCHLCNERTVVPDTCPNCYSRSIRFLGLGTQRLEQEVASAFPSARLLRWDRDVTESRNAHEKILGKFRRREADILIGTQMLAKGLHLPGVTLVGVVNADIGLFLPDFRAAERSFQLICQVAGRSGRGLAGGRVVIQSYQPQNYAIQAAAQQDYRAFYAQEIARRGELFLPPFTRLARLIYQHTNYQKTSSEAARVATELIRLQRREGYPNTRFVGPAPAPYDRIRGRYRWHLVFKSPDPALLLDQVELGEGWTVDIDPVQVL